MKAKSGDLNGFLDKGSTFRGELDFEDTLRIDGRFNGKISSKNELIVGETAHIDGEVRVGQLAISGTIEGTVVAEKRIEIHRTGKVFGSIETPVLVVEEGAVLEGEVAMGEKQSRPVPIEEAKKENQEPMAR
ncbi:MAG: polymer-forming cytoskeletal protein [Thermoanaerobaculia bacterium]|nr:polymer-forming cytoskeletal protein [Thermoanaerobaculia bacterium]